VERDDKVLIFALQVDKGWGVQITISIAVEGEHVEHF